MPAVLAIDTSTDACSVALAMPDQVRAAHRAIPRAHNRHIFSMIDEVLADVPLSDIDTFACGVGPGSFTGLRIAASVVQGLAWSLDKPIVAMCSLELQARSAAANRGIADGWLLSTTDAQIGQVYWRWFELQRGVLCARSEPNISQPESVITPDGRVAAIVVGSGAALKDRFEILQGAGVVKEWLEDCRPHAEHLAMTVRDQRDTLTLLKPEQLLPRYVQQDIGWKKLSEQPRRD